MRVSGKLFPDGLAGLIFDCDGVMIDSEEANRFFYDSVLSWLGFPPMTKEQEDYAFMATAQDALKRMLPKELHARIPEAIANGVDYQSDVLKRVKLMPGFEAFIKEAHGRGLRMAIDSNRTSEGIQRVLDFFALPLYFDPVISSSIAAPKPSPEGARLICESWGAAPSQALFVGDSENDRLAALSAGVPFAAFGAGSGMKCAVSAPNYDSLAKSLWGA